MNYFSSVIASTSNKTGNNMQCLWRVLTSRTFPGWTEERQEADRERKEEDDHGGQMQAPEHRQSERGQAEVRCGPEHTATAPQRASDIVFFGCKHDLKYTLHHLVSQHLTTHEPSLWEIVKLLLATKPFTDKQYAPDQQTLPGNFHVFRFSSVFKLCIGVCKCMGILQTGTANNKFGFLLMVSNVKVM